MWMGRDWGAARIEARAPLTATQSLTSSNPTKVEHQPTENRKAHPRSTR
jgi:hypothetical protein